MTLVLMMIVMFSTGKVGSFFTPNIIDKWRYLNERFKIYRSLASKKSFQPAASGKSFGFSVSFLNRLCYLPAPLKILLVARVKIVEQYLQRIL